MTSSSGSPVMAWRTWATSAAYVSRSTDPSQGERQWPISARAHGEMRDFLASLVVHCRMRNESCSAVSAPSAAARPRNGPM